MEIHLKVRWNRLFVVLSLCGMLLMMGNSPAPYWACEGKAVGDACNYGYAACSAPNGSCQLEKGECVDKPETPVNECLICTTR